MQPLKMYAQWRTKIYAAPEIYTVIDNEIEYADDRSDYYSLGIALLTLWSGEKTLAALGERKLLSLKRGESGRLPYPDNMPAPMLHLIKGLTVPVSEHRWGFEEFERWVKGENVPVHGEKNEHANTTGINILYNGSKGQRASSLPELAKLMVEDKKLAAQYLFSGQVARWMHEAGMPEIEAQINDFVTRQYPANREAAVMATAYLLDVDMPFASPSGKLLRTQEEIANDMTHFPAKYKPMMADKDSPLFVYFRAAGVDEFAQKFVPMAKKSDYDSFLAVWRLAYTLCPAAPFPVFDPRTPEKYYTYDTVEEIIDFFSRLPEHPYTDCNSAFPALLYDEAFIMWLSHRNAALAGKIKSKLAQEKKSNLLYYYIWYLLAPDRNYMLQKDGSQMFSIEQIAAQINKEFVHQTEDTGLPYCLQHLKDNRLYYYMKSKEVYKDKFDYIEYCFALDTKDRRNQAGPYNEKIATFKAIKALSGESFYYFPRSGHTVSNIEELKSVPIDEQRQELKQGKLREWLAVEFQENPFADLSESLTYETLLGKCTDAIADINRDDPVYDRYLDAETSVEVGAELCRKEVRKVRIWRTVFYVLAGLPMLALALAALFIGFAGFGHPSGMLSWCITAAFMAVAIRVIMIIPIFGDWLKQPFGDPIWLPKWIPAIIYALIFAASGFMMESHPGISRIAIPAMALTVFAWRWKVTVYDYPISTRQYADALHPDVSQIAIESLYYAWHPEVKEFDSEMLDRQNQFHEIIEDASKFTAKRTLWSLAPIMLLMGWYLCFSPMCEQYIKENDPERWERVFGEGKKSDSYGNLETVTYFADVKKSLSVRKSPSSKASKLGSLAKGEKMEVISIEGNWAKIKYADGIGYVNTDYIKKAEADIKKSDTKTQTKREAKTIQTSEPAKTSEIEPMPSETSTTPKSRLYTVSPNYREIEVFSAKNTQSQFVIGSLKNGENFTVLSNDGTWAKITYKGRDAYVKSSLIFQVQY